MPTKKKYTFHGNGIITKNVALFPDSASDTAYATKDSNLSSGDVRGRFRINESLAEIRYGNNGIPDRYVRTLSDKIEIKYGTNSLELDSSEFLMNSPSRIPGQLTTQGTLRSEGTFQAIGNVQYLVSGGNHNWGWVLLGNVGAHFLPINESKFYIENLHPGTYYVYASGVLSTTLPYGDVKLRINGIDLHDRTMKPPYVDAAGNCHVDVMGLLKTTITGNKCEVVMLYRNNLNQCRYGSIQAIALRGI